MKENCNIPKHWEIKHLEEITSVLGDGLHGTPKYSETGEYYFINGNNLTDGKIEIKANTKRVTFEEFEKYKKPLNERTIFVSINGTLGYTAFYRDEKVILGKSACYFNVLNTIDKNYIRYYLTTSSFTNYANKNATGSTIKNVGLKTMRELPIPIPPTIEEQQAIVSKIEELFSELDNGIAQLKTAQQQLKVYHQSLLKWAFEGKEQTTVGELFDFVGGGTPSKKVPEYWIGDIPWASVKDIKGDYLNGTQDRISKEGLNDSASNLAKPKDVILITRISPGKTIITNIETAINQDLKIVKPKFEATPKFIFYVFKSIEWECVKKSSGTTVLGINLTSLKEILVPKLNLKEQQLIVDELESKLTVCDKIEETISQSLQQAETLKQSILKQAFEGKLI